MAVPSFDERQTMRDLVVAFRHPRYADRRPIDVLRERKRARGETRI